LFSLFERNLVQLFSLPRASLGEKLADRPLDELFDGEARRLARLRQRREPRVVERNVNELGGHGRDDSVTYSAEYTLANNDLGGAQPVAGDVSVASWPSGSIFILL
jgi:hypothetical protein